MKRKNPAPAGEREQGETGNDDASQYTRPAPDIQAQFPVFASITPFLPGECREVVA